ncbi:hypothetical protein HPB50_012675 [Hyalomma asiaticum]|nr:hypothetical protein HPB50_012675 [Hyalomma asiaticum]
MESDALFVPLGVAAPPLYTTGAPAPWKLGALGTVVAREITHKVFGFADSREQLTTPEPPCFPNASLAYAFAVQAAYTALNLAFHERDTVIAKQRLRGLERFRDGQLLFLASCFTLCNADGDEAARNEVLCNEAVRNNRGFGKWFLCPQNSPMNPKDKCSF